MIFWESNTQQGCVLFVSFGRKAFFDFWYVFFESGDNPFMTKIKTIREFGKNIDEREQIYISAPNRQSDGQT